MTRDTDTFERDFAPAHNSVSNEISPLRELPRPRPCENPTRDTDTFPLSSPIKAGSLRRPDAESRAKFVCAHTSGAQLRFCCLQMAQPMRANAGHPAYVARHTLHPTYVAVVCRMQRVRDAGWPAAKAGHPTHAHTQRVQSYSTGFREQDPAVRTHLIEASVPQIHARAHAHTHARAHASTRAHIHKHARARARTHARTHARTRTHAHTCARAHTHTHTHTHTQTPCTCG